MAVTNSNKGVSAKCTAAADAVAGRMKIKRFEWSGATTNSHTLAIKDTSKNAVIVERTAGLPYSPQVIEFDPPITLANGFTVSTLGSGYVYAFFAY